MVEADLSGGNTPDHCTAPCPHRGAESSLWGGWWAWHELIQFGWMSLTIPVMLAYYEDAQYSRHAYPKPERCPAGCSRPDEAVNALRRQTMPTKSANEAQGTPFAQRFQESVTLIECDGKPVVVAREFGAFLGYGDEGRLLVTLITGDWSDEFIPDVDSILLKNGRLAEFKKVCAALGLNLVDKRAPSLLLLTQSGIQLVLSRSEKPEGKTFRRWLVSEAIPGYEAARRGELLPGSDAPRVEGPVAAPPAPLPRKIKGGALHPEAADVLRAGLEEVKREGGLSDEGRARLAQLVDHLSGTRVRALLAGPRSDAQRIEDEIRAALGPEPSESFRAISWNVTKDFLLRAALARGTPPDAEGRLLFLLQRKHAIDAWLEWQRKHGALSETAFTQLVKMLEGAVSLACGPLPGSS